MILAAFFSLAVLGGCSAPPATLELLTVARHALVEAKQTQAAQHEELLKQIEAQQAAMDAAFDADVTLAAAGGLKDSDGQPVPFNPQWVISARRGYTAARDVLAQQVRQAEAAHAVHQDNLAAADEALEMASQLVVQQWNIAERLKTHLMTVQRRLTHGQ
jgi:anti-sigma factor RsiW